MLSAVMGMHAATMLCAFWCDTAMCIMCKHRMHGPTCMCACMHQLLQLHFR